MLVGAFRPQTNPAPPPGSFKTVFDNSLATLQNIVRYLAITRGRWPSENQKQDSVGAWAKRLYFAARAMMDSVLRPYDLGSTQWYVLDQLANKGPTMQRDLVRTLHIERATLSGVVATSGAQRSRRSNARLRGSASTDASHHPLGHEALEIELPDPTELILAVAFDGADPAELAIARRVLQAATQRLNQHISGGNQA